MSITLIIIVVIVAIAAAVLIGLYNGLVRKRILTQEAWSQIDVQLKRRYDLIPNLVETVKGYAAHEKGTLEAVIAARNAASSATGVAEKAQAENMLTGALRQIFALSEAYPNLKANENFQQLQEEISHTENNIAFARQHYNDSAAIYNGAVQTFPSNMIAGMFGFAAREYFELEASGEREAPKVKF
ncbi:MAG: LemA family protein [Phycisphaerae bacterium]